MVASNSPSWEYLLPELFGTSPYSSRVNFRRWTRFLGFFYVLKSRKTQKLLLTEALPNYETNYLYSSVHSDLSSTFKCFSSACCSQVLLTNKLCRACSLHRTQNHKQSVTRCQKIAAGWHSLFDLDQRGGKRFLLLVNI